MEKVEVTIHVKEEHDIEKLRGKLKSLGFRLNDNFESYLVPIRGTVLNRSREGDFITITQQNY